MNRDVFFMIFGGENVERTKKKNRENYFEYYCFHLFVLKINQYYFHFFGSWNFREHECVPVISKREKLDS